MQLFQYKLLKYLFCIWTLINILQKNFCSIDVFLEANKKYETIRFDTLNEKYIWRIPRKL